MKKSFILLTMLMVILLLSCEKQTIHPLIGWWRVQSYETTYFADVPKTIENIDSVEFIDCLADFKHLSFSEDGRGTMYCKGALDCWFTWSIKNANILLINKDNEAGTLEYEFQITENLLRYTNEGVSPTAYWTCVNTATKGK